MLSGASAGRPQSRGPGTTSRLPGPTCLFIAVEDDINLPGIAAPKQVTALKRLLAGR